MHMDPNRNMLNDIFKMTKENNDMLHGMRRRAFVGGLLKFIIWGAIFIAPIWFYMTYLNESMQKMLTAFNQVQATGVSAQTQLGSFQNMFKEFTDKISFFPHPGTPTPQ